METNYDEPHFTSHVSLLLVLILPKHSWTKKEIEEMKEKLSFLVVMMDRRFGKRTVRLSSQRTVPTLKRGDGSMMFWSCFSLSGIGKLIAIRGIMKSEDYIKIWDENLQLSAQNLDLGWWFIFHQDNDPQHTSKSVTA